MRRRYDIVYIHLTFDGILFDGDRKSPYGDQPFLDVLCFEFEPKIGSGVGRAGLVMCDAYNSAEPEVRRVQA